MKWNVVKAGRVVGELEATEYPEAQRLAVEQHGHGARVSAPADAQAPVKASPRGRAFRARTGRVAR